MSVMKDKPVKGEKFWRTGALILLCGLVYYFSYDHGRQEVEARIESVRREAAAEMEIQRQEILRLQKLTAECRNGGGENAAAPSGLIERIPLRVNQSRIVFDGRLVITLLKVENIEGKALVQLNNIVEEKISAQEIMAGGAWRFHFDGRPWALVLSGLSMSSVSLNLMELKNESPEI